MGLNSPPDTVTQENIGRDPRYSVLTLILFLILVLSLRFRRFELHQLFLTLLLILIPGFCF